MLDSANIAKGFVSMNRVEQLSPDITLYLGDCLAVLRSMPDASVDSVVTDPPYGLSFMGKKWDYDVPSVEVWAECLRVLKPGGHLLAFAGTRTQHRMAVRIEDAGFEIRDMIAWVYSTGFPKSLDVSKAIDKAAGARGHDGHGFNAAGIGKSNGGSVFRSDHPDYVKPEAVTEDARQWQGWGTALKPAMEPITVARKPLGTSATNVLKMVESQLRERGVRGEILWKPESASGAAKSKKTTGSGSTAPSERSATSAKTADESVTQSAEQQSLKSSERLGTSGLNQIRGVSESFQGCTTSDCANPSSLPMEGSAPAAESVSATFSPLTTSTAEEPSTASKFMGRCTPNCAETDSHPDTESFAGIATGLTGSMETVRINRDSEGFFLWPKGLPEFVPGSPLTVAENVLTHGTGALNIDGCRVATPDGKPAWHYPNGPGGNVAQEIFNGLNSIRTEYTAPTSGRWPANLIHDGSDEVVGLFPVTHGAGSATDGKHCGGANPGHRNSPGGFQYGDAAHRFGDSDSAARFFYVPKANKRDRDEGLEGFEKKRGGAEQFDSRWKEGAGELRQPTRANIHPTVKPTALMRYLCRLVTPPGGVVLDPFLGSGSTGKAASIEGFKFIGIEIEPNYFDIACRRISNELKQPRLPFIKPEAKTKTAELFETVSA